MTRQTRRRLEREALKVGTAKMILDDKAKEDRLTDVDINYYGFLHGKTRRLRDEITRLDKQEPDMNKVLLRHVTGDLFSDRQKFWLRMDNKMRGVILSSVVLPVDEFSMDLPSDKLLNPERKAETKKPIEQLSDDQRKKPVSPQMMPVDEAFTALEGGS